MGPALRFHELDALRGLACLAVIMYHFLSRGPRNGEMPGLTTMFESVSRYGYLGVHLFFIISGFVILMSAEGVSARRFVASRAVRLFPALWAAATITAFTAWILGSTRYSVPLPDYLANLTMFNHWMAIKYVDGAYWSLHFELHFYLMMAVAIRFGMVKNIQWLFSAWLMISVVNLVRPMYPLQFWLAAQWAPLFVAGGVFYLIRTKGVSKRRLLLLGVAMLLALAYAMQEASALSARTGTTYSPIVAFAAVLGFFMIFAMISRGGFSIKGNRMTYMAGILTYPAYLLHQHFGFMLYDLFRSSFGVFFGFILMSVTVFFVACAVRAYVERPCNILFRRLTAELKPVRVPVG